MPSCVACGAELERPCAFPTPSTSGACTASPDRTTAAGVITEVRAGAGTGTIVVSVVSSCQ